MLFGDPLHYINKSSHNVPGHKIDPASTLNSIASTTGNYAKVSKAHFLGKIVHLENNMHCSFFIYNFYSVGFVDAGESLAECVIRETAEEAGVKINPESFELVDSNHWPNPAGSLMLGSIVTTKTEVSLFLTLY